MTFDKSEIVIYQTEDGHTKIDVHIENETVWLTQAQMSELFQTTKQNISLHINNAFKEGEIDPISVVKEYLTTAPNGKSYSTKHYNLEALDRDVKKQNENSSVDLILCAKQGDDVVEYALSRSMSPALIAEYQTHLPQKALLTNKLRELRELAEAECLVDEEDMGTGE